MKKEKFKELIDLNYKITRLDIDIQRLEEMINRLDIRIESVKNAAPVPVPACFKNEFINKLLGYYREQKEILEKQFEEL